MNFDSSFAHTFASDLVRYPNFLLFQLMTVSDARQGNSQILSRKFWGLVRELFGSPFNEARFASLTISKKMAPGD